MAEAGIKKITRKRMQGSKTLNLCGRQAETEKTSKEAPKHETTKSNKPNEA
jgi:hypothetical protein